MADPIGKMSAHQTYADGAAMVSRAVTNFLNWLNNDVRMRNDATRITGEASKVAKAQGGVLIVRSVGHVIDSESGGDFQTYLGLRIAGGGRTEEQAKAAFMAGLRAASQQRPDPRICTPDNLLGHPKKPPAQMMADTTHQEYRSYVTDAFKREQEYLAKKKGASITREFFFFTWNDWENYVNFARCQKR